MIKYIRKRDGRLEKFQPEKYYHWHKNGKIDGIIFLSNTIVDLELETVDYVRCWISDVGNKRIIQINGILQIKYLLSRCQLRGDPS